MLKDCACGIEIYVEYCQKTRDVVIMDSTPCKDGSYQRYSSIHGPSVAPAGEGLGAPGERYRLHLAELKDGTIRCLQRSKMPL